MKAQYWIAVAAIAATVSACSDDEELVRTEVNSPATKDYIEATMNSGDTRTYLAEGDEDIYWSEGDQILVYTFNTIGGASYRLPYELTSNPGSRSGTFAGDYLASTHGTKKVAFYPYTEANASYFGYDKNSLCVDVLLPATIECTGTDLNGFPMVALFDGESNTLNFRNACALLDLTIKNVPAGANVAKLTALADGGSRAPYLNGTAQIGFRPEGTDVSDETVFMQGISDDESTDISQLYPFMRVARYNTLYTPSATDIIKWKANDNKTQDVRVLVPLPLGVTFNLELAVGKVVTSGAEETYEVATVGTLASIKAERNTRFVREVDCSSDAGEEVCTVADAAAATEALAGTDGTDPVYEVVVESISGSNNTITLPANQDGSQDVRIRLQSVVNGAALSIIAADSDGETTVAKNVTIIADAEGMGGFGTLTLSLPTSTVTLQLAGEYTSAPSFGEVFANTGDNALILDSNVRVGVLMLADKSNVVVKSGASTNMEPDNSYGSATAYYEDDLSTAAAIMGYIAQLPIEAYYINFAQAGDQITLSQDINLTYYANLKITADNVSIDLNGYSITKSDVKYSTVAPVVIDGATGVSISTPSDNRGSIVADQGCEAAVLVNAGNINMTFEMNYLKIVGGNYAIKAVSGDIQMNYVDVSGAATNPVNIDYNNSYLQMREGTLSSN